MRFMILLKANGELATATPSRAKLLAELGRYNDQLIRAGVLLASDGLHPLSDGVRMRFAGSSPELATDAGADAREMLAGYWLLQVRSKEEAIEWVRRLPRPRGAEGVIELRRAMEPTDPVRRKG